MFFVIGGYLVHCMKWGGCRNNRRKSPGWGILPGFDIYIQGKKAVFLVIQRLESINQVKFKIYIIIYII